MSKPTPTPTPAQVQAAEAFLAAFNAFNASDATTRKATDKALTSALNRYRLAHRLSGAMGLLDCINHFNATHATA